MHVHQRGDLDLQSRHGPAGAPVTRVRAGGGHQRARHQHRGQIQRAQRRQRTQRPGHPLLDDPLVGLADLDVEQYRQPHHRHRSQQVDGHRPPQQPGAHRDAADDRLHDASRPASARRRPGPRRRRRARVTASTASAAVRTTAKVIIRLPNSTAWWIRGTSVTATGVKLPGKHCGQVGQPRPDAVTRTMAPVTAMPPWLRMTAAAMIRWTRRLGSGSLSTNRSSTRPTGTARS